MTQQINGMVRERLINCDAHFNNDQIEAVMKVVDDSGYSDMYEALRAIQASVICNDDMTFSFAIDKKVRSLFLGAILKAEGKV